MEIHNITFTIQINMYCFKVTTHEPCPVADDKDEEGEETAMVVEVELLVVVGGLRVEGAGLWLLVEAICASTSITSSTTSSEGSDSVRSNTGNSSSRYRHIW